MPKFHKRSSANSQHRGGMIGDTIYSHLSLLKSDFQMPRNLKADLLSIHETFETWLSEYNEAIDLASKMAEAPKGG